MLFQTLVITYNLLEDVEDGALDAMDSLIQLDLASNFLTTAPTISHVCDTLRSLVLRNNSIAEISNFYFSNCSQLTNLDLINNRIAAVYENSLRGLTNIKTLSLASNDIKDVACGAFRDMGRMQKLSITSNYLRELPCFDNSHPDMKLESLNLNRNSITFIAEADVLPLTHLTQMSVANNRLKNLDFLHGVPALQKVWASENPGIMIDPLTFENSFNITTYTMNEAGLLLFPVLRLSKKVIKIINIDTHSLSCVDIDHVAGMGELKELDLARGILERFPDPGCSEYFPGSQTTIANVSFPKLTWVDFTENRLYEFPWLPDMAVNSEIYLNYNQLDLFPPERLGLLRRVRILQISHNKADEFPDFSQLPLSNKLTHLRLSHNMIRSVNHSHISMLQRLYQLTLDNNQIPVLPDMSFAAGSLVEFPLNHNLLPHLDPVISTDDTLWTITDWPVHNSRITTIAKELLEQMSRLRFLRAQHNLITALPFLTAVGSSLEEAYFFGNQIDTVHRANLRGMTALKILNLADNMISSFPFIVLIDMPNIQQLLLQDNAIVIFADLSWFSAPPSFSLNIRSNPLNCSRELCWLRSFAGFSILKDTYLCREAPLNTIRFDDITDVQMDCFCKHYILTHLSVDKMVAISKMIF